MSLRVDKDFLDIRDINQIKNECFVEGKENDYGPAESLRAYGETSTALYIPFAYAKTRFKQSPNKETQFPETNYHFYSDKFPFRTDGGRDQENVFNEAKALIRKHRSALLSLHCGYGKCLAKDTPVLMYDGTVKPVQDIIVGDLLMGDDSTPRSVLTLACGREEMYTVTPDIGEPYTVNKSHILSLHVSNTAIKKLLNRDTDIIDISVNDFLKLSPSFQNMLHGYKVAVDYPEQLTGMDPYMIGHECVLIWENIPHVYKVNSKNIRLQVLAGLLDAKGVSQRDCYTFTHRSDTLINDVVYTARSLGLTVKHDNNTVSISGTIPTRLICKPDTSINCRTSPIKLVSVGIDDYYGFTIDGNHRFLLGDFTVTHNTYEAIRLAQASRLKCAVLAHRGVLFDQWVESIQKFTDAKVQQVDTDGVLDPDADFYIFNISFVHKRWQKDKKCWVPKKLGIYKDTIGMLIVDEAHIACAAEMSRALLYFNPRVALALTATPVRKDGMDKALELYFGKYDMTRIIRIATDPFTVYRLPTGIKPEFTRNAFGKKDWNSVISSLVENETRNKLIIKLIRKFKEYNILVLTKRKTHCTLLSKELEQLKITNTVMTGTAKKYDKTARVLLSTYSKLGVGFDDTRLNMLIVACSVTEVEQYAGRLRDGKNKKRIIIDLVDDDPNCLSHWSERRGWYVSRNGNIKHYYRDFPDEKPASVAKPPPRLAKAKVQDNPETERPKRLARRLPEN